MGVGGMRENLPVRPKRPKLENLPVRPKMPTKKFNENLPVGNSDFKNIMTQKARQLHGEGYSIRDSYAIVEDFANKMFGDKFISENTNKISRVRFGRREMNEINKAFNNYLYEQGVKIDPSRIPGGRIPDGPAPRPMPGPRPGPGPRDIDPNWNPGPKPGPRPGPGPKPRPDFPPPPGPRPPRPDGPAPRPPMPPGPRDVDPRWKDLPSGPGGGGYTPQTVSPPRDITPQTVKDRVSDTLGGQSAQAGPALSKNENMKPHENATALRDWTTNMKEALVQERDYDGDGRIESGQDEWKGSRDKAIKRNMNELNPAFDQYYMNPKALVRDRESGASAKVHAKPQQGAKGRATGTTKKGYVPQTQREGKLSNVVNKVMQEKQVFYTDDKDRVRKFDDGR